MADPGLLISSSANPILKDVRRAVTQGSATSGGFWVAESFHLLEEALRSPVEWRAVLAARSKFGRVAALLKGHAEIPLRAVEDALFDSIAATSSSQGVLSLVKPKDWRMEDVAVFPGLIVVLDGVQDPGNAGAMARSAEAFGASGIVFPKGTVDPANPKTVRASAGSLFRLPFVTGIAAATAREACQARGRMILAGTPSEGVALEKCDFRRPAVLVIGSEAHGVSDAWRPMATLFHIPTHGVESLNAAMAGAVALYEAARQQRHAGGEPR